MRLVLDQILERRVIGEPHSLTANLCYPIKGVKRLTDPELAGGALLDVGVYPINFAMMVFGNEIECIESSCNKTDSGVDESNSMTITFKGGKMAVLHSSWSVRLIEEEPFSAAADSLNSSTSIIVRHQCVRPRL
jgi:predicted dehydrogenase